MFLTGLIVILIIIVGWFLLKKYKPEWALAIESRLPKTPASLSPVIDKIYIISQKLYEKIPSYIKKYASGVKNIAVKAYDAIPKGLPPKSDIIPIIKPAEDIVKSSIKEIKVQIVKTTPTAKAIVEKAKPSVEQIAVKTQDGVIKVSSILFKQIVNKIKDVVSKLRNKIGKKPVSVQPAAAKLVKEVNKELSKTVDKTLIKKHEEDIKIAQIPETKYRTTYDHLQYDEDELPFYEILLELELKLDSITEHNLMSYYDFYKLDRCVGLLSNMAMHQHRNFVNSRPLGDTSVTFCENLADIEKTPQRTYAGKSVREKTDMALRDIIDPNIKVESYASEQPFTSYYSLDKASRDYYDY